VPQTKDEDDEGEGVEETKQVIGIGGAVLERPRQPLDESRAEAVEIEIGALSNRVITEINEAADGNANKADHGVGDEKGKQPAPREAAHKGAGNFVEQEPFQSAVQGIEPTECGEVRIEKSNPRD